MATAYVLADAFVVHACVHHALRSFHPHTLLCQFVWCAVEAPLLSTSYQYCCYSTHLGSFLLHYQPTEDAEEATEQQE
jgi:hypothetical protein